MLWLLKRVLFRPGNTYNNIMTMTYISDHFAKCLLLNQLSAIVTLVTKIMINIRDITVLIMFIVSDFLFMNYTVIIMIAI